MSLSGTPEHSVSLGMNRPSVPESIVGQNLTMQAFLQLAGVMGGHPFVKVVVQRSSRICHYINHAVYQYHADYIAEHILSLERHEVRNNIDTYNHLFYESNERDFFLGILSLHERNGGRFLALETVEVDNMGTEMILEFVDAVKTSLDPSYELFFKPANHAQESTVASIPVDQLPRVHSFEIFSDSSFVALNCGASQGRLRMFATEESYRAQRDTLQWYDIVVMDRIPDDIPRVSGLVNSQHTTPLSHTNVLANSWQIPNCIQLGVMQELSEKDLDGKWVQYVVKAEANHVAISALPTAPLLTKPAWSIQKIKLEVPEVARTEILALEQLRTSDRYRYGTKAANLGELTHILRNGSRRMLGFYSIPRPPRENLLGYLAKRTGCMDERRLEQAALEFLRGHVKVPKGIAIPFGIQQAFLEASPSIQQCIGKLKMALVLDAKEIDSLAVQLQSLIKAARFPNALRDQIDMAVASQLGGCTSLVVRSSSNAEDLKDFSAAGIYESINHVTSADNLFESIKEVWASLVSPRSVRLRHEVGISLDDAYMGVIVQEEVVSRIGGVMVTTNPLNQANDFRNVYINVAASSQDVVSDRSLPFQYLYNAVEGGGRTLSLGNAKHNLEAAHLDRLQDLAVVGKLLQSHFSQDYTFSAPVDIEWAADERNLYVLQLRPYST